MAFLRRLETSSSWDIFPLLLRLLCLDGPSTGIRKFVFSQLMPEELNCALNDTSVRAEEQCNCLGNLHSALIYKEYIYCDWCDLKWIWIVLIRMWHSESIFPEIEQPNKCKPQREKVVLYLFWESSSWYISVGSYQKLVMNLDDPSFGIYNILRITKQSILIPH